MKTTTRRRAFNTTRAAAAALLIIAAGGSTTAFQAQRPRTMGGSVTQGDDAVTDPPVPSMKAPETTPGASAATSVVVSQADLGTAIDMPETYVSCGQCRAAFAITPDVMGRSRRMECSVCGHTWFQSQDRLGRINTGFEMIPMPDRDMERIKLNISEGKHPKHIGDYKMYVGNISFRCTEDDLYELFGEYGPVGDVSLVKDQETGRPRGFGFVTMRNLADGEKCLSELDGVELGGRELSVRPPNN